MEIEEKSKEIEPKREKVREERRERESVCGVRE